MKDLEIRGAGDLLGAEQSGFINEMGFETYQKLMQEALEELQNEDDFKIYLKMKKTVKIIQISKESILTLILSDVARFLCEFYGRKTFFISKLAEIQPKKNCKNLKMN